MTKCCSSSIMWNAKESVAPQLGQANFTVSHSAPLGRTILSCVDIYGPIGLFILLAEKLIRRS